MESTVTLRRNKSRLRDSLLYGLPLTALFLALMYYWFAVADRYVVFLYNHDMGAVVPDTSPFSRVTSSRYWMASLVAGGFILVIYTAVNWLMGRLRANYAPPPWQIVWLVCVPFFILFIPLITMTANNPALPWQNAAVVTLAALIGLTLALIPGELAARKPWDLVWLAADGWGLAFILMTLAQLDDIVRWLADGFDWRIALSLVLIGLGVCWLLLLTAVRYWRGVFVGNFISLAVAAACTTYLILPLLHHLLGTDGYFYITDSDNFFAGSILMQLGAWTFMAVIIWALLALRTRLEERKDAKNYCK
jgi:hypothetical protein